MTEQYTYSSSIKSTASDELINTYFIRPAAGLIVRLLYRTIISPNQVTIASTFVGFAAAVLYVGGTQAHNLAAGLLITLKDILDSADGQLARAKNQYSRRGRFMDSIGDFFVNAFVFAAISTALYESSHSVWNVIPGIVGFFSLTLRVSYHVFYQTAFLHLNDRYTVNRLTEEVREEDLRQDAITLRLQTIFQWLYGWQDSLMKKIDEWSRAGLTHSQSNDIDWYGNLPALRIS
ncbi:MAG: CDP-alcohol phosphatidyltransferase family protein, partial [bacterium]